MEQGREPSSPSAPWVGARGPVRDRIPAHQPPGPPRYRGFQAVVGARAAAAVFRPPPLFFFPPSYTHRPWFTPPAAPARSWAVVQKPTNDFVCVLVEIDSRPPKPSPGSHMPWGLHRVGDLRPDFDLPYTRPPVLKTSGGSPGRGFAPTGAVGVSLRRSGPGAPA
jgi:hypothetical protein